MSNSRTDDLTHVVIPDVANFDWEAFKARVAAFDPRSAGTNVLYRAFVDALDVDEEGEENYDALGFDPTEQFLEYEGHPAVELTPAIVDGIHAVLARDVEFIRERATNPEKYIRDSENYTTFGYGFSAMQVARQLVLTGSYNEYCAAAGEGGPTNQLEQIIFERFLCLGLLSAPE